MMNWRMRNTPNAPARNGRIRPGVGVHQAKVAHHDEQRHEGHDARHHERPQDHQEQDPLSRELKLGKRVAQHRTEEQVAERDGSRDDGRIEEETTEVLAAEELGEVLEGPLDGPPGGRHLAQLGCRLEGSEQHPDEGDDHDQQADDEGQRDPHSAAIPSRPSRRSSGRCGRGSLRRGCHFATTDQVSGRKSRNWTKVNIPIAMNRMNAIAAV